MPSMLLALLGNYLELRSQQPTVHVAPLVGLPSSMNNTSFVRLPLEGKSGSHKLYAVISPEDSDRVNKIARSWNLSSSGYVVAGTRDPITKRYRLWYLHKLISHGETTKHINGDRLDNRRSNLMPSLPRGKRSPAVLRIAPSCMDACIDVKNCPESASFVCVEYDEGKRYSGGILRYKPKGYGTLYEFNSNTLSVGYWDDGQLHNGMVIRCSPFPPRMQEEEETRKRAFQFGISSGFLVTNKVDFQPLQPSSSSKPQAD